jgi:hypothetical protein
MRIQHSNDYNLLGAMEQVIEVEAKSKHQKEYSPFVRLPNVSRVKIELSVMDELFAKFHIKKRKGPGTLHYVDYCNDDLNRFLLRSIKRLKTARSHRVY